MIIRTYWLFITLLLASHTLASGVYQSPEEFLDEAFDANPPSPTVLWLKGDIKKNTKEILGHRYPGLRLRYWLKDNRTAWILEEIGKDKPITVGLVVKDNALESIRVLTFRESRGWEVRYPFFTDQFKGLMLTDDNKLNRHIDGISGATLSVRALKKLARLSLYLHSKAMASNDP
jgi:hypothetical protein